MAGELTPEILYIKPALGEDEQGNAVAGISVECMLGPYGPFREDYLRASFDELSAKREIERIAEQMRRLLGG